MTTGMTVHRQPPASKEDKAEAQVNRPAARRKSEVHLGREIQACIGQQLRATYDAAVSERVPPNIADLIYLLSDQDDGAA